MSYVLNPIERIIDSVRVYFNNFLDDYQKVWNDILEVDNRCPYAVECSHKKEKIVPNYLFTEQTMPGTPNLIASFFTIPNICRKTEGDICEGQVDYLPNTIEKEV